MIIVTPAAFVEQGRNALKKKSVPKNSFLPAAQRDNFLISRLMQNGCFLSEPFFFMVKPITDRCGTRIFARRMARLTA
ncbi:MAG: hypothetical protein ABR955_02435, partial [Verrucomicrobiota bacterium]